MIQSKKAQSRKKAPFRTARCGNVSVNIYRISPANKSPYFQVADYTQGKRRLRTFTKETKAFHEAQRIARSLSKGDVTAANLTNAQAAAFARATEHIAPTGDSIEIATARYTEAVNILGSGSLLTAAAKEYAKRHPVNLPTLLVEDAVAQFLKVKANRNVSDRYLGDLKSRLTRFAASFKTGIANVDTSDIQNWLDSLNLNPQSYKNFRTVIHTLFEFSIARRYVTENPVTGVEQPKVRQSDKEIFTPDELRTLIAHADSDFLPYLVIGAFAGLRTSEIERLEWSDIREEAIHVTAKKAKTASRRIVPVSNNLAKHLYPYTGKEGKVWPLSHNRLSMQQRRISKLSATPWKHNALRHSYASYRLATVKNDAQVAYELGNSAAVIHRHYKELVSEAAAKEWFSIAPKELENIIPIARQNA